MAIIQARRDLEGKSPMTMTSLRSTTLSVTLGDHAADHLWMHFTRMSAYANKPVPTIERGEGAYIFDTAGKRYLDGLSGPVRRAGRATAGPSWPMWSPRRRASWRSSRSGPTPTRRRSSWPTGWRREAPGDLNKVFFSSGGGESVETAWKVAKQYFKLTGKPPRPR